MAFYDERFERLDESALRELQLGRLRDLLARTWEKNAFYRAHWQAAGVDVERIRSLEDFAATVPTVTKGDFLADQQEEPPYGRRHLHARSQGVPLFLSTTSGTSGRGQEVHAQTPREWSETGRTYSYGYCWAGLKPSDGLALALPLTMLGGGRLEAQGADYYGLTLLPIGNDDAERKLETIRRFAPAGVIGMSSYLGRLGAAVEEGPPPAGLRAVITGGEAASISWLGRLEDMWGAKVFDRYGSSQAGNDHMFTCEHGLGTVDRPGMLHNIDPQVLTEVVDPDTGAHVADGERGDLVITILYRPDTPIIRCWTGDRGVYHNAAYCQCGRPFRGVEVASIGRSDDMKKVKGINIWPQAVDDVVFERPDVSEYQVVLSSGPGGNEIATLKVVPRTAVPDELEAEMQQTLGEAVARRIGIRFEVEVVPPASLQHDEWKARRWLDQRDHALSVSANTKETK